jgi:hypothetical protein
MAHLRRLIQQRPNTTVDFFIPGESAINVIESYKTQGKILSYTNTNQSDTVNVIEIKFNTQDDYIQFQNETDINTSSMERYNHCSNFKISWSGENLEV